MKRRIFAILMALMIAITAVGCRITTGKQPEETTTPTPTLSAEGQKIVDAYTEQLKNGPLADETISQKESFASLVYVPFEGATMEEAYLIGYLPEDSRAVQEIKAIAEEYSKEYFNFSYETMAGDESWYLMTSDLISKYVENGEREDKIKWAMDRKAVCKSLGIKEFATFVITSDGRAVVSMKCYVEISASEEGMTLIEKGTMTDDNGRYFTRTLDLRRENGAWKISNVDNYITEGVVYKNIQ